MNLDLMVYILELIYKQIYKKRAYVMNLDEYEDAGNQICLDYKHMIQLCVVIFVLNLLIICLVIML